MGIADRLKDLKTKAVDATAEHSDKIHEAVEKVATTADQRTGGKYHERIQQAGAKAGSFVDGLKGPEQQAAGDGSDDAPESAAAVEPDAPDRT
jgi:hypothetical protein